MEVGPELHGISYIVFSSFEYIYITYLSYLSELDMNFSYCIYVYIHKNIKCDDCYSSLRFYCVFYHQLKSFRSKTEEGKISNFTSQAGLVKIPAL